MTVVVLINWNGADDTLACLRSLGVAEGDFRVVVADNGSTDDSAERIQSFLASDEWTTTSAHPAEVLPLGHNWGFAIGNNKAIAYARRYQPDSYMLLNNDTEVEPDFMVKLHAYRVAHPDVKVVGPLICYWAEKNRIWSCGGRLTFGTRKGFFRNQTTGEVERTPLPVTFISGCALLADASLVDDEGRLLTERFFFGEEDYEFAHRMRRAGERM
nr:glycosyltransferase family 2 protein [Bacteroidaceae bacterium]